MMSQYILINDIRFDISDYYYWGDLAEEAQQQGIEDLEKATWKEDSEDMMPREDGKTVNDVQYSSDMLCYFVKQLLEARDEKGDRWVKDHFAFFFLYVNNYNRRVDYDSYDNAFIDVYDSYKDFFAEQADELYYMLDKKNRLLYYDFEREWDKEWRANGYYSFVYDNKIAIFAP